MKKIVALLLVALMLSTAVFAEDIILIAPNPAAKTVSVRVEGVTENLYDGKIAWTEGMTALSALETVLAEAGVEYVIKDSQYGGKYVSAVGADVEGAFGGYDGWMYYVDGQSPMFSIDACALNGGEELLVAYADMSAVLPIITAQRDAKGIVTVQVTADVTTYDESNNWAPVVTRQPMADAKLTADGADYVTDAQGKAVLSAESSAKEAVAVQVEKAAEGGAPLLVRLPAGYTVDLSAVEAEKIAFSDVADDAWYAPYVVNMARQGVVEGFPDGTFQPVGKVTRAQVANVLYKLSGSVPVNYLLPFSDVAQDQWYAEAIRWAASEKIVTGFEDGTFRPDAYVTRQDLAVMLVRYQQAAEIRLSQEGEAPAFADNDQIASYAAEAVYVLQKAGVVNGTDGKFNPAATAGRGELCKMVSAFVISD